MLSSDDEITITVIGSSVFFLFLSLVIVVAVVSYQNRKRNSLLEISLLRSEYTREILQSKVEIQETTLQQIGQELHDDIGQLLAVAKINLSILEEMNHTAETGQYITETSEIINDSIVNLRSITKSFDGDFVKEFGLEESLANELARIEKTGKYTVNMHITGDRLPLGYEKEIMIFRISQESLNNIIKHSAADSIQVQLTFAEQAFLLTISDNGNGFRESANPGKSLNLSGAGLRNMNRRAELIGASLDIRSAPHTGTTICVRLPQTGILPSYPVS
jgi:two-component system, NarL family, sensor kinase